MDPHADFHGQMILIALAVAMCVAVVVLVFLLWIGRGNNRDFRNGTKGRNIARPTRKKKRK